MKWLVCVSILIAACQSASIGPDIPVRVVYERPEYQVASLRNLQAKSQLTQEEQVVANKEYEEHKRVSGIKNLDEKTQLSPDEQAIAYKNLPKIVTPDLPEVESFNNNKVELLEAYKEQNIDDIYDKIQEIVLNGAKNIETAVENTETIEGQPSKEEILTKVNSTLENFLEETRAVLSLKTKNNVKQDNPPGNIFQQISSSFQTATNNFFSGFTNPQNTQGDQPAGNPIVNGFQSFFNQITGNRPAEAAPGVQGDEQPATPAQGGGPGQFISNAFNNIQQSINGFLQPQTTPPTGTQGDAPAAPTNPLQGAINQFTNAFQSFQNAIPNPFQPQPAAAAAGSQADAPAAPNQPFGGIFQNGLQQVASAIGLNPTTVSPLQSDENQSNQNLLGVGQQIASSISNNNPITQGQTQISEAINNLGQGGNPIEAGQQAVSQVISQQQANRPIQSALQNLVPFRRRTTTTTKVPDSSDPTTPKKELASNEVTPAAAVEQQEPEVTDKPAEPAAETAPAADSTE